MASDELVIRRNAKGETIIPYPLFKGLDFEAICKAVGADKRGSMFKPSMARGGQRG